MVQILGIAKKVIKFGEISGKDDILIVGEKRIAHIGNRTKRSLEMDSIQRELEARPLNMAKTWIKKRIEKEK